jgi:hypothetical protein
VGYTYGPVYYPDSPELHNARPIAIGLSEVRGDIDIILRPSRSTRIEGVLSGLSVLTSGRTFLSIVADGPERPQEYTPTIRHSVGTNGAFVVDLVPPGRYRLRAIASQSEPPRLLWADTAITAEGVDHTGLTLPLRPAVRLTGRSLFDGREALPPGTSARVLLKPVGSGSVRSMVVGGWNATREGALQSSGRFKIEHVLPGRYHLEAVVSGGPPGAWGLARALDGNRDLLDAPIDIAGENDLSDVTLVFTTTQTELAGRLVSADGRPATDFFVIAIPADTTHWSVGSRRIRAMLPARDGTFATRGLPPGEYYLAATTDLDAADLIDRGFLRELVAAGIPLTLSEGERKVQDIRISTPSGPLPTGSSSSR